MTNSNFEELERRCNAINMKRYLRYLLALLFFLAVVATVYFTFFTNKPIITQTDKKQSQESKIPKSKKTITKTKILKEKPKPISQKNSKIQRVEVQKVAKKIVKKREDKVEVKNDKKVIQKKSLAYDTVFLSPNIVVPKILKDKKIQKREKKEIISKKKSISKDSVNIKKKRVIIKVKSFKDEESLLKDNRGDENFETTMRLSRYYFEKSKFQKAIYWSKKANHYKPSSFEPWLIYAKAKIKQHKKPEAIRAIKTFLSYFDSKDARKFLMKLEGE